MIDLDKIIKKLAEQRPILYSEADFKHALAWMINSENPEIQIRLEKRIDLEYYPKMYVDITLEENNKLIPIELKYKTRLFKRDIQGEYFSLITQGAADISRYKFLADIARIEKMVQQIDNCYFGYALFLTNEYLYWRRGNKVTFDEQFKIYDGRILKEEMKWNKNSKTGKMKEHKDSINLSKEYIVEWQNYHTFKEPNGKFMYLIVDV